MRVNKKIRLNDAHWKRMVDDTGLLRQARSSLPYLGGGYSTQDNARLLMASALYYEVTGRDEHLDTAHRALSFLLYAEAGGWFHGWMGYDRRFGPRRASEESYGRCVWCLGYVTSRAALPQGLREAADELLRRIIPSAEHLTSIYACAYTVLGMQLWEDCPNCRQKVAEHCARIAKSYHTHADEIWLWYEDEMSACCAVIPHAMLAGHQMLGDEKCLEMGLESLHFLLELTLRDGVLWPLGSHGRHCRGGTPAPFDQRPVDVCSTLLACLKAHEVTGDAGHLERAERCLDWFLGANSLGEPLLDPENGGCYNAITPEGLDRDQSGESLLSWYMSFLSMGLAQGAAEN